MADKTHIEWTRGDDGTPGATWNPITGCTMVSAGCTNCYAMGLAATRLRDHPSRAGLTRETGGRHVWTGEVRLNEQWLDQPLRWRKPRRIFVCAHGDLFHESVPDEWIDQVFAVMRDAKQHVFQVLTKRPERMRSYLGRFRPARSGPNDAPHARPYVTRDGVDSWRRPKREVMFHASEGWPLPNVWLGVSVEDQPTADARIPHLLATPAAVRFVSAEPLLGPIHLGVDRSDEKHDWLTGHRQEVDLAPDGGGMWSGRGAGLDWVIVGGESGPGARPMHPDWARSLRDQCAAAGVAYFFKQWGEWAPERQAKPSDLVDARRQLIASANGDVTSGLMSYGDDAWLLSRLGKTRAGRLLDGRTHDAMPGASA